MEWPFVSRREYQRALAERNEADRCLTLARANLVVMERELCTCPWPADAMKTRHLLSCRLMVMERQKAQEKRRHLSL